MHSVAGLSWVGDLAIVFFGEWYLYVLLIIFVYFAARDYVSGGWYALLNYTVALLAALIARFGVATLIRHFYERPRPYVALGVSHLLTDSAYSFPSGHTIFIVALGVSAHFFNKKLAYFLYVSAIIVGVARVMAGVHYPSDIVGGALLGALVGLAAYWIFKQIKKPRLDTGA